MVPSAVEKAVDSRWPASNRVLERILSLRGLVGLAARELCWDGATVTNVTADCLHETAVGSKENREKEASRWAE